MYDQAKGYMVFKDVTERTNWTIKCIDIFKKEYNSNDIDSYDKWKKDGERFLNEEFINSSMFPFLNDGQPELLEWIHGTYLAPQYIKKCVYYTDVNDACEFLESMSHIFSSHGLESFSAVIDAIIVECKFNTMEYEDLLNEI